MNRVKPGKAEGKKSVKTQGKSRVEHGRPFGPLGPCRVGPTLMCETHRSCLLLLASSACLRSAGCEHFVSALGPSALGWGKSNLGFINLGICFFSYRDRDSVPITNR